MRTEFSAKIKMTAWERCKGCCETCGAKIIGTAEYDHVIPDAIGGTATLDNVAVLCRTCHRAKTSGEDMPRIAKTRRQHAKHIGATGSKRKIASRGFGWGRPNVKHLEDL